MKKTVILVLLLVFISAQANTRTSTRANAPKAFEIPRTAVIPIQDTQSNRRYELYIKLPQDYAENKKKAYPVIYFTDAVWHIELLSASTEFLMEDVILVGISWQKDMDAALLDEVGEYVSRFRDYTVNQSSKPEHQAKYHFGQANRHLAFIRNDVIPFVEKNYRTDANNRSYFGYSAGGLFGTYVLLAEPDTFKNYLLGSPSVQGDIPYLKELESSDASRNKALNANVFITHGSLEETAAEHIQVYMQLLKKRNDKKLSIKYMVVEGSHQTAFPLTGVQGVTWLSDVIKGTE